MNKKILLATITLLASLTIFVGCSDTATDVETSGTEVSTENSGEVLEEIPADELMDMENIELTEEELMAMLGLNEPQETFTEGELCVDFGTADVELFDTVYEAGEFSFAYNSDNWLESGFDVEGTELVLVDTNPVDFESPANIYITPVSELPTFYSINEYLQMIVDSSLTIVGVDILSMGVDFIGDYQVGIIETVESYTDEIIDELIAQGYITETDLENIGGRELLLSLPDMYQVFMIARHGEDLYTFSGAYYSNDIKRDEIIEAVDGYLTTLVPRPIEVDTETESTDESAEEVEETTEETEEETAEE